MQFDPIVHKIPTPSDTINIVGCGGLNFGTMTEAWGSPRGGKSTFAYQAAGQFLVVYGDYARVLIADAEGSADLLRLEYVFGIRPGIKVGLDGKETKMPGGDPRVVLVPGHTIEAASSHIRKYAHQWSKEGLLSLHVWDSISASQTAVDYEEVMKSLKTGEAVNPYAGGRSLRPRVLGHNVNAILGQLWDIPASVILINQARARMEYGGGEQSGGGYAFKHAIHYSIRFKYQKSFEDNIGALRKGTMSKMTVEKSKFFPKVFDIPIFIYDNQGGLIDSTEEMIMTMYGSGFIKPSGAWYKFTDEAREFISDEALMEKSWHGMAKLTEACRNEGLHEELKSIFEKYIRKNFNLVDIAYKLKEQRLEEAA